MYLLVHCDKISKLSTIKGVKPTLDELEAVTRYVSKMHVPLSWVLQEIWISGPGLMRCKNKDNREMEGRQ